MISLGLDFGEKRIGVALSDEMGSMALPHGVIPFQNRKQLLGDILALVKDYRVEKIVVGLPKTLKGEESFAAQKVTAEVEWLKPQVNAAWVLWDERLTTAEVDRMLIDADVRRGKRREVRDQLAAQRILQSYLDYERNRPS